MIPDRLVGVDVGGSIIKAGVVNLANGDLLKRQPPSATPKPPTPEAIANTVKELVIPLDVDGPVGITLPCVVHGGVAETAINIHRSWVGTDAIELFRKVLDDRPIFVMNDADAAGVSEARHGAAQYGTVLILTFGTGVGSALLRDGVLVPNMEFGQLMVDGRVAEDLTAASVRRAERLSWASWAARTNRYLEIVEAVARLDLIVIGGGICDEAHQWRHLLAARAPITTAVHENDAGIVGAAICASNGYQP